MPIMEVVLEQTYAQQQIINRWNYLASGTPAAVSFSFALIEAMGGIYDGLLVPPNYPPDRMLRRICAIQSSSVVSQLISARDVYSVTDFYETPFVEPLNGTIGGDALGPASAWGFRTNRTRLDIRRGTKRFVGVTEALISNLGVPNGTGVTGLQDVAAAMTEVLEYDDEGNTLTFQPIVVSKEKYLPDPLRPDREAYRYYETEAEQLDHIATSIVWDYYTSTRTQVSRQIGRGR